MRDSRQARESSDNPMLKAFCRVAPSVRLSILAIAPADFFLRARDFNFLTCTGVHGVLLVSFFTCLVSHDLTAAISIGSRLFCRFANLKAIRRIC
jgi:hypothetical protein